MPLLAPIRSRLRGADGFTLIEVLVALTVLVVGILGVFTALESSQRLSLVSERHATMVHVAQQEIERIEGIPYSQVGLSSAPGTSSDPANPDFYVSGSNYQVDRTTHATEPLDIDTTNGQVTPLQSWSLVSDGGLLSGQIYDFITWSTDSNCGQGCPSSNNYKRITVAVTMTNGLQPTPVYVSSVISDPSAAPNGGTNNGSGGNPLDNPATTCKNSQNQTVTCSSPIDSGNPTTYFLHDWAATNSGSPQPPSADHATHPTVGVISGQTCTTTQSQASGSNIAGCPTPDLMDTSSPSGTTLYHYSSEQGTTGYPGGRLLLPTCAGLCSGSSGGGTGSSSDCSTGNWASTFLNPQSELWVTAPLTSSTTFTGEGGISFFTQTLNGTPAVVSFCVEVYDVPPDGSAGSLKDILAWPPVAEGGAAYVPATDPGTGSNWPMTASQITFIFSYSSSAVTVPAGDRIAVRIWQKAVSNTPIAILYDNTSYPAEVQLNTQ